MTNPITCPRCNSFKTNNNGGNTLKDGSKVKRYYCQGCQKTFQVRRTNIMDTLSQLAPNLVPDLEHHFITSAPECYDGFGTTTVTFLPYKLKGKRDPLRIVFIPDQALDNHWQSYRYESGLYNCLPLDVIDDWIPLWEKIEQQPELGV